MRCCPKCSVLRDGRERPYCQYSNECCEECDNYDNCVDYSEQSAKMIKRKVHDFKEDYVQKTHEMKNKDKAIRGRKNGNKYRENKESIEEY